MSIKPQLEKLIKVAQRAEIHYVDSGGIISERKIDPLALCFTLEEGWILIAFCHKKQANRRFQLSNIQRLQALNEYFPPPSAVLYRHYQPH